MAEPPMSVSAEKYHGGCLRCTAAAVAQAGHGQGGELPPRVSRYASGAIYIKLVTQVLEISDLFQFGA